MAKDTETKGENKMNNEIILKEKENGDLIVVNISDDTIKDIIEISNDVALWVKPTIGGFSINNKTVPEIVGVICEISPYLVKWENKKPHKIPNVSRGYDIPEGYERRVDLKIMVNGQILGLSLAKSSFIYQLSPYVRYLDNIGFRPDNVLTKLKVKTTANAYGTFNVVIFEMVGPVDDVISKQTEPPEPPIPPESLIESNQETPPVIPSEWA